MAAPVHACTTECARAADPATTQLSFSPLALSQASYYCDWINHVWNGLWLGIVYTCVLLVRGAAAGHTHMQLGSHTQADAQPGRHGPHQRCSVSPDCWALPCACHQDVITFRAAGNPVMAELLTWVSDIGGVQGPHRNGLLGAPAATASLVIRAPAPRNYSGDILSPTQRRAHHTWLARRAVRPVRHLWGCRGGGGPLGRAPRVAAAAAAHAH